MSLISMLSMIVVKYWLEPKVKRRFNFPIPTELIVVIVMTSTCYGFNLNENEKVGVVGHIPIGLPYPKLPNFKYASNMIADAVIIAVVVFSISVSMAKLFAKKHDYAIHANQEWYAYGIVHIISSFFSCHCAGSSLSRSALQESQGGNSQLASIFSCAIILLVLLFLAPLFKHTPQ
uniref:SLC26A/SulP transporter domain-containing protein n=1 Tax=Romanomermis culicivorax TaxID=13658 RepID=A0A915KMR7_ROMCU